MVKQPTTFLIKDTRGLKTHRGMLELALNNKTTVVVMMYDVNVDYKGEELTFFLEFVKEQCDSLHYKPISILIAHKVDDGVVNRMGVPNQRKITTETGQMYKEQYGFDHYCEVSTLRSVNVYEPLDLVLEINRTGIDQHVDVDVENKWNDSLHNDDEESRQSSSGCEIQ